MPEFPDLTVYQEALERHAGGRTLAAIELKSPFLLRSVEPPLSAFEGRVLQGLRRLGKRLVFDFGEEHFLLLHLMIAGRLRWRKPTQGMGKAALARFDFGDGVLWLTEASPKKRASLHAVRGESELEGFARAGLELPGSSLDEFRAALAKRNRTLKRALTDPDIVSAVGNAYSDEILFRARLSPLTWTERLSDEEVAGLHGAACAVLGEWTDRLRRAAGEGFPEKVTAFHEQMAVHGRYRKPCPECGAPVQRIRYASNECNYCAQCQCGGKLLADRGLSQLHRGDWPKTLEELEEKRRN